LTFEVNLPTNLGELTFKNTSKWVIDHIGVERVRVVCTRDLSTFEVVAAPLPPPEPPLSRPYPLSSQVTSPMMWEKTMNLMIEQGYQHQYGTYMTFKARSIALHFTLKILTLL
jgi:hypothetical protein